MKKNKNGLLHYFRLEPKLAQKLDQRISRIGYQSRSDFFTAVSYVALYGDKTENSPANHCEQKNVETLPKSVSTWLKRTTPKATEEEIQAQLHQLIEDQLFPVIAMKGIDLAYEKTWEDTRKTFHEQHGIWATESDIREAYQSFAAIHKAELEQYRQTQLTENEDKP